MTTKQILGVIAITVAVSITLCQMYRDIGWKEMVLVLGFLGSTIGLALLGIWLLLSK